MRKWTPKIEPFHTFFSTSKLFNPRNLLWLLSRSRGDISFRSSPASNMYGKRKSFGEIKTQATLVRRVHFQLVAFIRIIHQTCLSHNNVFLWEMSLKKCFKILLMVIRIPQQYVTSYGGHHHCSFTCGVYAHILQHSQNVHFSTKHIHQTHSNQLTDKINEPVY